MINVTQASIVLAGLSVLIGILALGGGLFFGLLVQREYPPDVPKEEEPAIAPALQAKRSAAYRLGVTVLIGLAILTGVEYAVGIALYSLVALLIIGLFKAGVIIQYFMHVSSLWAEEGH